VRVEHVMKGYRADHYTQIERLAFMSFFERAHAVYCRNLQDQITEPVLKSLLDRIAKDEERHEQFWSNLVAHCLQTHRDETVEAIARRAAELGVVGGDIEPYQDKVANVAKTGIFDEAALRTVISDRITAWDLAAEPRLSQFVTSS
jgi:acyl-[acyl-carrier-protein] desaturase